MDKMVNWVELVGPNVVAALAKESDVDLTSGIITLLEKFGERVESEVRTRNVRHKHLAKIDWELSSTNDFVRKEVNEVRNVYVNPALQTTQSLTVLQHPETYLPITYLALGPLPELVIYVTRQYHVSGNQGLTLAFKFRRETARMTSPVSGAINYMCTTCEQRKWKMSVKEVLIGWIQIASNLPLESLAPVPRTRKRAASPQRIRGRWKPRRVEAVEETPKPKHTDSVKGGEDKEGETEGQQDFKNKRMKKNSDMGTRGHQPESDSNMENELVEYSPQPSTTKQEPQTAENDHPENKAEKSK